MSAPNPDSITTAMYRHHGDKLTVRHRHWEAKLLEVKFIKTYHEIAYGREHEGLLKLFKFPHRHIAMELQKVDSSILPTLEFY